MKLTWYGQSAFRVDLKNTSLLIDPFFTGNPAFEGDVEEISKGIEYIVLTHGHGDHVGDTVEIAKRTGATVLANFDLAQWLGSKGVENLDPANTGGTLYHDGFSVSYTNAHHSSAMMEENGVSQCLGNANGIVLQAEGEKTLYHAGDTDIFGDMALINEIYRPRIGIVPIGDRFTMNPETAALACRKFFDFDTVIPCHYASFPILVQEPDRFIKAMEGVAPVTVPQKNMAFEV